MNKERRGVAVTVEDVLENNPQEDFEEVAAVMLYELLVKHENSNDTWKILESKQEEHLIYEDIIK